MIIANGAWDTMGEGEFLVIMLAAFSTICILILMLLRKNK